MFLLSKGCILYRLSKQALKRRAFWHGSVYPIIEYGHDKSKVFCRYRAQRFKLSHELFEYALHKLNIFGCRIPRAKPPFKITRHIDHQMACHLFIGHAAYNLLNRLQRIATARMPGAHLHSALETIEGVREHNLLLDMGLATAKVCRDGLKRDVAGKVAHGLIIPFSQPWCAMSPGFPAPDVAHPSPIHSMCLWHDVLQNGNRAALGPPLRTK